MTQRPEPTSTAIDWLDHLLDGGLAAAEALLFIAPTGTGKTTLLTRMAWNSAMAGRMAVFLSFDQAIEGDISNRFLAMASGLPREVTEQGVPAEDMAKTNQQLEKVAGRLYMEYMNPAWRNEVVTLVSGLIEATSNSAPPLVLLDLVEYAVPREGRSGEPMRGLPCDHVVNYVSDILVGLLRLGTRVVLSSQAGDPRRPQRQGRPLFDHTDVHVNRDLPKLFDHSVVLTPVDVKRGQNVVVYSRGILDSANSPRVPVQLDGAHNNLIWKPELRFDERCGSLVPNQVGDDILMQRTQL
ncbi:MAG: ATPase domain-containing protein [Phycisphaerae bacterium]